MNEGGKGKAWARDVEMDSAAPPQKVLSPLNSLARMFGASSVPVTSHLSVAASTSDGSGATSSSTSAVVIPSKSKAMGGLTVMRPTKTKMARNLFAIDYMREHPKTTTGEFALVYDALNEATKEKYKATRKEQPAT